MRTRVFASITLILVMVFVGSPSSAQESTAVEPLETPEASFEGEMTVTGSLIPRGDLTALSPVTVMEVPTELTYSGIVRIEDLITQMPQAFAGQNSTAANGATGTATVDLRNLGSRRTLVLVNGRRMAYGDFTGTDLNAIPAPLVKRMDVLTGGASTVYGSDALAGVVNFILDTDFTGVRGGLQYSFYNHDNNNSYAQQLNLDAGFDPPTGWTNDGDAVNGNIAVGGSFADGKGHAVAYIDYRRIDELTMAVRDYVACSINSTDNGPRCGGSWANGEGTFLAYNADGTPNGFYILDTADAGGDGHSLRPYFGDELFNWGAYNHIQRPDEKWNAGAFTNYEINQHFDVYLEIMYMNDYTDAQIAPSGSFGWNRPISCSNPMLSPQQHDVLCVQGGYTNDEYAEVWILRRNTEGAPRSNQLGHSNGRILAGVRGNIGDAWTYDLYGLRAESLLQDSYHNDLSVTRLDYALDVIEDPATGEWVCRNEEARADGCVPWNPFQEGAVTQEAADYLSLTTVLWAKTRTEVSSLVFSGDLEGYGMTIPSASEGIQVAVGAEYRSEWMNQVPDEAYSSMDGAGAGAPIIPISGGFNVREAFAEVLVPIVQDVRGANDFSLELGYRYSDYSTFGGFDTYKGLVNWAVSSSWRVRGGYNRAVRAPSLVELYNPANLGGGGFVDLCEGESPIATFEQCALTGVTAAQYGNIPSSSFGGIFQGYSNALYGGNVDLGPEVGDTVTAGLVWTPQSIHGLSVTLDYYDIRISETIGILPAVTINRVCMDTGDPDYCERIHRDAVGSIWLTDDGYIDATNQNMGERTVSGIDLNANWLIGLGGSGFLATDLMGSYLIAQNLKDPRYEFECVGYFGYECGQPKSLWRHRFRATWESNFRLNLSLAWRYLGAAENEVFSSSPDLGDPERQEYVRINGSDSVSAFNWFDLAASYTMRNGLKFTVGVNNILDEDPAFLPGYGGFWGDINLYANYDPLGRYVFGSVQFNF